MKRPLGLQVGALLFALSPILTTADPCTIAVMDGSVTADGRPLLWKNRDVDELGQEVRYFDDGFHGGYIVIVTTGENETTTAYVGLNDDGFAVMNSNAPDLYTGLPSSHGILMKRALRECGTVADFEALLIATSGQRGHIWANFGVIDRQGNAAIFETNDWDYRKHDAGEEGGFVVRANASLWGSGELGSRYYRAYKLIAGAIGADQLDHRNMVQVIAKDIGGPPSLPCGQWYTGDPALSRYRTRSSVVVRGVLPGEDPRLSTFWCTLGEPSCGVSVPLWSFAGAPPPELLAPGKTAPLCLEIQEKELRGYTDLTIDTTIETAALVGRDGAGGIQRYSLGIEAEALDAAEMELSSWRRRFPSASEMAQFERERATRSYLYFAAELSPWEADIDIAASGGDSAAPDGPVALDDTRTATTGLAPTLLHPSVTMTDVAIRFHLPRATHARISVFDVQGRRLAVLEDGILPPGFHSRSWDARGAASGVYLCCLDTGQPRVTRKVLVAR